MFASTPSWRWPNQWRIRTQLLALILAVLLPTAGVIVYDTIEASDQALERAYRQTARLATGTVAELTEFIQETERTLAIIADRPLVRELDPQHCDPIIREVSVLFPDFNNLTLRDTHDNILCAYVSNPVRLAAGAKSAWFQQAIESGRFGISNAFFSDSTGLWVSVATYPVRDQAGKVTGLLALRIELQALQKRVIHDIPGDAQISVLDRDAKFLMRTPDPQTWIGKSAANAASVKSRAQSRFDGFDRAVGVDGIARLYAIKPVPGTGWLVAAGLPEDGIFAAYRTHLTRSTAIGLAALLMAIVLALWLSRSVAKSIRQLELASVRVAGGELAARVPTEGPAEIATVAREFNRMLDTRERIELDLRESSRRYSDMLGNLELASLMLDGQARITYCNDYMLRLTGWRREEVVGGDWFALFIPPELSYLRDRFADLLKGDTLARHHTNEILTRSGERRLINWHNSLLHSPTGETIGTASVGEDITERKKAEHKIQYLNRVYATLSAINTLIVRVGDRDELFREACRIAVEQGGFRMSLIGIVDQSAMTIVPVASAGKDEDLLTAIKAKWSSGEDAPTTMAGRAIREQKAVVSNDYRSDPNVLFGKTYAESGVRSMAVLPLIVADEAVGVLALYASEIEFFHEEELKLLTELAGDIAFAINYIDKQTQLDYLATHDILTNLPNRNLMRDRITQAISHAKRAGRQIALMYLDLDRFKVINDGYGHPFGDAVLKAAGERLASVVREEDAVGRQSGDEFLVLLGDLRNSDDAYIVAQKLLDAFAQPFLLQERQVYVNVSIGVSIYPQDGKTAETLLGNADVAMYRSKELGRGTYQFFTQVMSEETQQRVELETQLRVAIAQHQLHLAYQPKVDLASGRITGCEALLRWNHPELGAISPARFIPIAEESGLIVPIGDWVLRAACQQNKVWHEAGLPPIVVSVNVSARQFLQQDVVAWVLKTLEETALAPELLELELTESLIAQDTEKVIATINQLKAAGVKHSIDDFGTGYSSLSYLQRFRVDTLKIDQSFIRNMLKDPDDAVIALAVIALGHSFRMKVIAEGVETAEHCTFLRQHGCDEIQGYYFSKPVAPGEFEAMLKSGKSLAQLGPLGSVETTLSKRIVPRDLTPRPIRRTK